MTSFQANDENIQVTAIRINGRILIDGPVDTSRVWSDGVTSSGVNPLISQMFDGDTGFGGNISVVSSGATGATVTLTFDLPIPVSSSLGLYPYNGATGACNCTCNGNSTQVLLQAGQNLTPSLVDITAALEGDTSLSSFTWIYPTVNGGNFDQAAIHSWVVDGKLLVDAPDLGPYSKLYQTWSQWVVQTLRLELAEADALRSMLKSHAQTYSAGSDYCEGSVIKAFGELWIAISDAPATTFADLPAIKTHPNWEQLNISIN